MTSSMRLSLIGGQRYRGGFSGRHHPETLQRLSLLVGRVAWEQKSDLVADGGSATLTSVPDSNDSGRRQHIESTVAYLRSYSIHMVRRRWARCFDKRLARLQPSREALSVHWIANTPKM